MRENEKLKLLNSCVFRTSIFIVVVAYFLLASYWLHVTSVYTPTLITKFSTYSELMKEPWWIATYYSSELGLSVGIVLRWIAGVIALYCAVIFLIYGARALDKIKGKAGAAILLEGGYILSYAPSAFLGLVYSIADSRNLWYFEPRPPWIIVFLAAGLACLAMIVGIAPPVFKLGSKIIRGASWIEIAKWASITGIAYLFAMFWWNYSMCWLATLVYWPERAQPGVEILSNPIAASSFTITIFGLLLVAAYSLKVVMPAIKGRPEDIDKHKLGYMLMAFSAYFILMLILYMVAGGYHAEPTVWMEIIGPHNPDLWCISLMLPGAWLSWRSR